MNQFAHWIALYVISDKGTYFDSSGVEQIPREITKKEVFDESFFSVNVTKSTVSCGFGHIY